jgi:predicted outer membrane repeat protein
MNRAIIGTIKKAFIGLAVTLALAGCKNLLEPPKAPAAPAGSAGTFTLEIGGVSTGRTILSTDVPGFAAYTFAFTGSGADVTVDRTPAAVGDPVILNAGIWNLTVTAYLDGGKTKAAARGSLTGITISGGANTSRSLELKPIIEAGATGLFRWNIGYPSTVTSANMTITPLDATTGTAGQTLYFLGGTTQVSADNASSPLRLNTGYYRVEFSLNDGKHNIGREEYLHVYQNMTSAFEYTFTVAQFTTATVTSGADSGAGTLRNAIANAAAGSTILIDNAVETINLTSRLTIDKNLTIQGNGVTITRAASWTTVSDSSQLLYIYVSNGSITANLNRIHFKDGRAANYGAAIYNYGERVNLESCVFSGNQTSGTGDPVGYGGAIYTVAGNLTVKGCTFYQNSSARYGGAIYVSSGDVGLRGNLFYGNTAANGYPVVYRQGGYVTSSGYNVVDAALGTETAQSGFTPLSPDDRTINSLPISPVSFRPLSGRGAMNVIYGIDSYPRVDFYGDAITNGAAAGAVQTAASGGYYLDLSVNYPNGGSVSIAPQPNTDGMVSGAITITAMPVSGYAFAYWLQDGTKAGSANPLTLTLSAHTTLRAVFSRTVMVTSFNDEADSVTTPGTLRYALTNAQNDDIITLSGVTPGTTTIALTSRLPTITKNITIQGNGITLTSAASWTTETSTGLLYVYNINSDAITVNISRIHFKNGGTYRYPIFQYADRGTVLNLESCVFSGNRGSEGGAIHVTGTGTLVVKGCTFYNNSARDAGGAVWPDGGIVSLTGNLFYGNIAGTGYPVVSQSLAQGAVTSGGYNVVDVALGTGATKSGFTARTGDVAISALPISPASFRLFSNSAAANIIATLPDGYPAVDFYGNTISNGAAAGAVQARTAISDGYFLDLSVNLANRGSVSAAPQTDAESMVPTGTVTVTAAPASGYAFAYWLKDGTKAGSANPLTLTINAHTSLQAVFGLAVTTDSALRSALTNALDGDIIMFSGVTPGTTTIALTSRLPTITKNITIQGNGITLTRAASWTTVSDSSQMLYIYNAGSNITVNLSRIHFKGGRTTDYGAAINNAGETLNMESCVFSDNRTNGSGDAVGYGGAIYNTGTLTVKGCTFYNNNAFYHGGAIYTSDVSTLTLTGNLFYGNTSSGGSGQVVFWGGAVTSGGYNVMDVSMGTGSLQSGFNPIASDNTLSSLSISGTPFNTTTFAPVSGLGSVLPATPPAGFPTVDFNGNTRTFPGAPGAVN